MTRRISAILLLALALRAAAFAPSSPRQHDKHVASPLPRNHLARGRRNSILPDVDLLGTRTDPWMMRLHGRARQAIREGKHDVAGEIYMSILYRMPEVTEVSPAAREKTYLLLALHEQRKQNLIAARKVFWEGIRCFPHSSKLLVALALMESKHGRVDKAQRLLKIVAHLDQKAAPVLRWKIFQEGRA